MQSSRGDLKKMGRGLSKRLRGGLFYGGLGLALGIVGGFWGGYGLQSPLREQDFADTPGFSDAGESLISALTSGPRGKLGGYSRQTPKSAALWSQSSKGQSGGGSSRAKKELQSASEAQARSQKKQLWTEISRWRAILPPLQSLADQAAHERDFAVDHQQALLRKGLDTNNKYPVRASRWRRGWERRLKQAAVVDLEVAAKADVGQAEVERPGLDEAQAQAQAEASPTRQEPSHREDLLSIAIRAHLRSAMAAAMYSQSQARRARIADKLWIFGQLAKKDEHFALNQDALRRRLSDPGRPWCVGCLRSPLPGLFHSRLTSDQNLWLDLEWCPAGRVLSAKPGEVVQTPVDARLVGIERLRDGSRRLVLDAGSAWTWIFEGIEISRTEGLRIGQKIQAGQRIGVVANRVAPRQKGDGLGKRDLHGVRKESRREAGPDPKGWGALYLELRHATRAVDPASFYLASP